MKQLKRILIAAARGYGIGAACGLIFTVGFMLPVLYMAGANIVEHLAAAKITVHSVGFVVMCANILLGLE